MVTVATAAKASLALGVPHCDAITACALRAERGSSAAGELDSAGGRVGILRVALSLLPHLFFLARWKWRRTGSTIAFGAATLGLSYAILLLKPSWGFSLVFALLPMVAGVFGKATRIMRFGPLLAGAAVFAFLFFLPKILGFQKDTQLFLPRLLVCIHSKQILETTPKTVSPSVHNPGVPDEIFHEELKKAYRTALEQPSGYPTLGFQSDYILYFSGFFSNIQRKEGWNDRELAAACYSAYFQAWFQVPSAMLQKIAKQMTLFLFPRGGDFYSAGSTIELDKFATSRRCLPDSQLSLEVQKIYQSYKESLKRVEADRPHPPGFPVLAGWHTCLLLAPFGCNLRFLQPLLLSGYGRKADRCGSLDWQS